MNRPPWKTEAEMCDAFMDAARAAGWTVYPETAGFDILLVSGGLQVGVEAKLHPNVKVLSQALGWTRTIYRPVEEHRAHRGYHRGELLVPGKVGPTYHAVVVPNSTDGFVELARFCRILVFVPREHEYDPKDPHHGWRFSIDTPADAVLWWPPWEHETPCTLPSVVPSGPAGTPCPMVLTPWKEKAIRVCLRLRARGYVTSKDFKELGIDMTRWVQSHWLLPLFVEDAPGGVRHLQREGRHYKYGPNPTHRLPDEQHPAEAQALAALEEG